MTRYRPTTAAERADERRIRQWLARCVTVAELFPGTGISAELWDTPEGYQIRGRGIELLGLDPATMFHALPGALTEQQAIQAAENLIITRLREAAA